MYSFDVAARFGIAFDRALVYGKAGWVWGRFDISGGSTSGGHVDSYTGEETLDGLLLGVGLEYALTNNWTTKLEYNSLNYGATSVALTECYSVGGCDAFSRSLSADQHIVEFGVNSKFDVGAPPF
ncbi:outer membrane protein [Rhodoplanes roseus]|uniref:Outer membrane protein beta-barrel domain-containing protein n=1 Tax=Rhodoplanes roseus TaxID=29409 RepID=A0A327KQM3_9BRAD|nr:outer membrane beta-barrel protein [Rhodoplanes roseus]RAI40216.1 hypothetical protein CH341_24220 [Rhodoplanes roseus]